MLQSALTPEEESRRGDLAKIVLENALFVEACNHLDAELRLMRERVPMSDRDMHTRIILAEQMQAKVLDYLKAVMMSGDAAKLQLRERRSLADRIDYARQHGLRNAFL